MRITKLAMKNFRQFEQKRIEFSEQFNVLIGQNGSGKTAVLDALAICLGSFFLGLDDVSSPSIDSSEVHRQKFDYEGQVDLQPQYPCAVGCTGVVLEGISQVWYRTLLGPKRKTTRRHAEGVARIARVRQSQVRQGEKVDLPVLAYYGTGRLFLEKKLMTSQGAKIGSRFDGYRDCLDPASTQKHFNDWMRKQAFIAAQEGRSSVHVDAIERAVVSCVQAADRFRYDIRHEQLRLYLKDGRVMPFNDLSDGYRNMLVMVADIAWRAAVLNPHHGAEVLANSEGVVLIDEIDLHLHPEWQRRVVNDLRSAFPRIQFIATTHSPFVIQSLLHGELINLDPELAEGEYVGKSPEDIVENVMGVDVPQRSERHQEMMEAAERYYQILEELRDENNPEVLQLRAELDRLLEPFADDPAGQAFLKMKRQAAESERERS